METVFDIKAYIYCWSFDKLLHILQQKKFTDNLNEEYMYFYTDISNQYHVRQKTTVWII